MSNKCVVVLAPNGRRQTVKVNPNTTILQVLEEVCKKQGFKAEEYDITHHNKKLDATAIMRYSGLPNNAQLEMAAALKTRAETQVKVGLTFESGGRVVGEFMPSDSLWQVVKTLCPNEAEADEVANVLPVVIYMGREECGKENLKNTTLRSLGITTGGATLRFFRKTPEELHRQANVSAPLSRPSTAVKEPIRNPSNNNNSISTCPIPKDISNYPSMCNLKRESEIKQDPAPAPENESSFSNIKPASDKSSSNMSRDDVASIPESALDSLSGKKKSESEVVEMDYEDSSETSQASSSQTSIPHTSVSSNVKGVPFDEPEETIVFLGERNAVLFDMATARACKPEDVPDDFFDLTLDDAKQLLRDLKRRQAALEEQPLLTSQYRDLEKSKHMLSALNQYRRCIIRIQFPNQLVLQGTFTPLEKVSHVMQFVRGFLEDTSIDFHIFTTPPKVVLHSDQTLYDASCVPGAVVHFMSASPCPEHGCHLRQDIMAQVSTATAAASAAQKSRGTPNPQPCSSSALVGGAGTSTADIVLPRASVSSAPISSNRLPSSQSTAQPSDKKVPKWFKSSK